MKCQMYSALFLAVVGFALPAQSQPSPIDWTLEEFQPNVPYGGRADTIAVNPSDNRIMFVASESGGLFKTTDGGTHWSHVDTLGAYYTSAVAYVTSDILLATATDRFSVGNEGGGIWRSSDGGVTWSHIPSPSLGGPRDLRFDAREISIAPDTGDIFVATSYGVAKSSDQGASWIVRGPINFAAISVSAQSGNLVIAGSNDSEILHQGRSLGRWWRNLGRHKFSGPCQFSGPCLRLARACRLAPRRQYLLRLWRSRLFRQ